MGFRAKERRYAIELDRDGLITAEGEGPIALEGRWTPEHLVLGAVATCTVISLRYHARQASLEVAATASARGEVAPRPDDGVYAFVQIECEIEAEIRPLPPSDEVADLLGRAERGCFVGSSLRAKPRYRWTVNGNVLA